MGGLLARGGGPSFGEVLNRTKIMNFKSSRGKALTEPLRWKSRASGVVAFC